MPTKSETAVTKSYDELSDDVKAVMDRAVRTSREQYWCDIFDRFAGRIFGVADNDVVDSDGLSCRGRDREGFDKDGFDRDGYNKEGRTAAGFDKEGYDIEGFDRHGLNKDGVDRQGRDKYRFDDNGLDQEGYNAEGRRYRGDRAWYAEQAAKPAEEFRYDRNYNTRPAPKKSVKEKLGF